MSGGLNCPGFSWVEGSNVGRLLVGPASRQLVYPMVSWGRGLVAEGSLVGPLSSGLVSPLLSWFGELPIAWRFRGLGCL